LIRGVYWVLAGSRLPLTRIKTKLIIDLKQEFACEDTQKHPSFHYGHSGLHWCRIRGWGRLVAGNAGKRRERGVRTFKSFTGSQTETPGRSACC
jgi:hypothetical protein